MQSDNTNPCPPQRQVRALFDDTTLTVYQAYSRHIAEAAVAVGTFVSPFKLDRMTWIKPSFLWMMHRSGWATKPGQEHVLAIRIARTQFDQALTEACLSQYDPAVYTGHDDWLQRLRTSRVRVQWDPERSLHLDPLPWRTIQVGLAGEAIKSYVTRWITGITDITKTVHDLHRLFRAGDLRAIQHRLPREEPYPLTQEAARATAASELIE